VLDQASSRITDPSRPITSRTIAYQLVERGSVAREAAKAQCLGKAVVTM
jgi:hypothetical protein